jgi:hypothetical protein
MNKELEAFMLGTAHGTAIGFFSGLALCLAIASCGGQHRGLEYSSDLEAAERPSLQDRLILSLDSLDMTCKREWRADLGDSVWTCPDPRPMAPPQGTKQGTGNVK